MTYNEFATMFREEKVVVKIEKTKAFEYLCDRMNNNGFEISTSYILPDVSIFEYAVSASHEGYVYLIRSSRGEELVTMAPEGNPSAKAAIKIHAEEVNDSTYVDEIMELLNV